MIEEDYLSLTQIAKKAKTSPQLMRHWLSHEDAPQPTIIGGHKVFDKEEVEKWLEDR